MDHRLNYYAKNMLSLSSPCTRFICISMDKKDFSKLLDKGLIDLRAGKR